MSSLSKFFAVMVNYHDPARLALDFCAYASCLAQEQCTQSTGRSFYSGSREALAHCRWPVHVGLPYHAGLQTSRSVTLRFSAGSSSLPLTTSGMSSEGIAHTCGRYGYVTKVFLFFWVLFGPPRNLTTVFLTAIGLLADAGSHAFGRNREHDRL